MTFRPRLLPGGAGEPAPQSDADLVRLTLSGLSLSGERPPVAGGEPFTELVRRYEARILGLAWHLLAHREDARDVAQDTFLRAFRSLATFRPDGSFERWLMRIAVNAARDEMARRGRRVAQPLEDVRESAVSADARPEAETADLARRVVAALPDLAPREREVVILRDVEGLDVEEIADLLGLEPPTVRRHLARGRLRLRSLLGS